MLLGYRKVFMMKLLTITVPSYNSEAYLDRCMATLLPGGDEVEILIVDDGSTDRTAEIADEYERKYPNIVRAIHKENGGHGDAVTTGIRNATGLFFKVVDSDDSLAPEAYKQVLDFLRRIVKKNHELDMLISNFVYDRHDENGDVLRPVQLSGFHQAVRHRGKSCFHDDHIIGADGAGQDQRPKGIDQPKGLDIQISRN